jgi:agmatine/peptidylarginine deiminase
MRHHCLLSSTLCLLMAASCKGPTTSAAKGHFESFTNEQMEAAFDQQVIFPEYLPAQGVIISAQLTQLLGRGDIVRALLDTGIERLVVMTSRLWPDDLSDSRWNVLTKAAGKDLPKIELLRSSRETPSVWARDWAPLTAIGVPGTLREGQTLLLDFNYYTDRASDDATPQMAETAWGWPRVSAPVYNEAGNFMINESRTCLMTARVSVANSARTAQTIDRVLSDEEIVELYKRLGGCRQTRIFPSLPRDIETTGHIDLWAKYLNDTTVIVNDLEPQTLATEQPPRPRILFLKEWLDTRARELSDMGFTVVRIPMPLPRSQIFRSYTNSLLLNGSALVPVYKDSRGATDADLYPAYEAKAKAIYEQAGYRFVPLQSDDLIRKAGAIHCVTMQFGKAR